MDSFRHALTTRTNAGGMADVRVSAVFRSGQVMATLVLEQAPKQEVEHFLTA